MKHIITFWLLLAMLLSPAAFSNQEKKYDKRSPEEIKQRNRAYHQEWMKVSHLAQKALTGRQVLVRVYNDWQKDFRAFVLVSVKLNGLSLGLNQVESAYGQMSESAVIVVTAQDQKDELVAAVIDGTIHAKPYKKKSSGFYIWPRSFADPGWWTFKDALGNPIPNAEVELLIGSGSDKNPQISIDLGSLNGKGQLKTPRLSTLLRSYSFIVSHPDYGTALVEPPSDYPPDDPPKTYTAPIVPIGTMGAV